MGLQATWFDDFSIFFVFFDVAALMGGIPWSLFRVFAEPMPKESKRHVHTSRKSAFE